MKKVEAKLPGISLFASRFGEIRYFMAPMAGISDVVFRRLIREMGAQIVVSELISAEGLLRSSPKTMELAQFAEEERPIGIQIFGSTQEAMVIAAKKVEEMGADFLDLNFGCPVKKIVCDGAGAAWLCNLEKLSQLLIAIKKEIQIPLTIKVRTGWDEKSINVREVVKLAADAGVSWIAIHGRTRAQGYTGMADWELIRDVAQDSSIPIVGNGDLVTANMAKEKIDGGWAHAVMIGRGALKNPWIFQELLALEEKTSEESEGVGYDFTKLISRHFDLALEYRDRKRAFLSLKKFLAWYAAGHTDSSRFRAAIFSTSDVEELQNLAFSFFEKTMGPPRINTTEPFLMGGHG